MNITSRHYSPRQFRPKSSNSILTFTLQIQDQLKKMWGQILNSILFLYMYMRTTTIEFRVPVKMKEEFKKLCSNLDATMSETLRSYISESLKKHKTLLRESS